MKEDFSFVKVGLDKIPIGLANRREIISTISDFKLFFIFLVIEIILIVINIILEIKRKQKK